MRKLTSRVAFLLASLPVLLSAQNYVFGPNVRVNDDSPGSHGHMLRSPGRRNIAARGDTVYVAEASDRANDGYFHAYFARSTDGGGSFLPSIRVDSNQDVTNGPSLALDDSGSVHLCWGGRTLTGYPCISYAKSTDGGQSFSVPIAASETCYDRSASIAVSRGGQRVYVARDQGVYPDYDVILSRSTDGGRTFALPETRVNSDTTESATNPTVAVFDDSLLMIAWDAYGLGVYFSRSTNGGLTFEDQRMLNDTAGGSARERASIGADSTDGVYVVYRHPAAALSISMSSDTGSTFQPERAIPGTAGDNPSLRVSPDGKLYLAYDCPGGSSDVVRFIFSPDRGDTFFSPVNPCDAPYAAGVLFPTVSANERGQAFVAWEDNRNDLHGFNDDVYLAAGVMSGIAETRRDLLEVNALHVWPNPCRATLHVCCSDAAHRPTSIEVFDLSGRLVRLLSGLRSHSDGWTVDWDGSDVSGTAGAPGIYFIRVSTTGGNLTRQVQFLGK